MKLPSYMVASGLLVFMVGCGSGGYADGGAYSASDASTPPAQIGPNFENSQTYSHTYSDGSTITNTNSYDNGTFSYSNTRTDPRGTTTTNAYNGQTNTFYSAGSRSTSSK